MLTKPFEFGPEGNLVGAVFGVPERKRRPVGTIIWGMGMQETLLAYKLSRLGVPSILVRVKGSAIGDDLSYAPTLAAHGVQLCGFAMDELTRQQGTTHCVVIGACARASLAINYAVADERVVGVVATNMLIWGFGASMLARARRILSEPGRALRWVSRKTKSRTPKGAGNANAGALPPDFDFGAIGVHRNLPELLERCVARNVHVRIVCTTGDDSLAHLQTRFRRPMRRLHATRLVTMQVIRSNLHRVNDDEQASAQLSEGIHAWLKELLNVLGPGPTHRNVQPPEVALSA